MARRIEGAETILSTDLAEAVGRRGGMDVFSIPFFGGAAVF